MRIQRWGDSSPDKSPQVFDSELAHHASQLARRDAILSITGTDPYSSTVQHLEGPPGVGSAQNQQALFGVGGGGGIAILDVDFGAGESVGDLGQCARLVVTVHHQHVVLDDECAVFFEQQQRLARVTHHHANDAVVHGVAGGNCVDVDFGLG